MQYVFVIHMLCNSHKSFKKMMMEEEEKRRYYYWFYGYIKGYFVWVLYRPDHLCTYYWKLSRNFSYFQMLGKFRNDFDTLSL